VLMGYGTGAIMAVPAHDERDFAFATKFDIPIRQVIQPVIVDTVNPPREGAENTVRELAICVIKNPKDNTYLTLRWKQFPWHNMVTGGIEPGEDVVTAALREITEETGYTTLKFTGRLHLTTNGNFYAAHKKVNRTITLHTLGFELVSDKQVAHKRAHYEDFDVEWVSREKLNDLQPLAELPYILRWIDEGDYPYSGEGRMINSEQYDGQNSSEMRDKIIADLAKKGVAKERVNYKLRDWIFSRQHYWGEPIPIIHCPEHGAVAVPDKDLPVELPPVDHYEPTDTGESPLAAIEGWVATKCPVCKKPAKRETDTMPNWAGSSWYYLRYFDAHNNKAFADRKKLDYWGEVDLYLGGMEHTTLHLLYSRFWHQFFYDQGLVPTPEPYKARRGQGIILAADGTKMSKSKGNVVNPSEVIEDGYGADALRLSIAFLAPYDQTTPWNPEGVAGTYRFLQRVWTLTQEYLAGTPRADAEPETRLHRATHAVTKKVTKDLDAMSFNTAIAALMEYVNEAYKIKTDLPAAKGSSAWDEAIPALAQLVAPFAPHIAEELWQQLGNKTSVHVSDWPTWDEAALEQDLVTIVVQVNGKVRATLELSPDATKQQVEEAALVDPRIQQYVADKPKRVIYVPGKLVNIVV
jgi:leucyl-tRNA synthetase